MKTTSSVLAILLCIACKPISPALTELKDIECIIQEEPKEALTRLNEIDKNSLSGTQEKGLYALLLSMALDKNYIDLQSDSIITPAVQYYSRRGDKQHRFLTYYYQGRVYENAKEYEKALKVLIQAESLIDDSISGEYKVRLHLAKQRVFSRQFADKEAFNEILKAKAISRKLQNPEYYFRNCLDLASYYDKHRDSLKYKAELDSLKTWMDGKHLQHASDYYNKILRNYLIWQKTKKDSVETLLSNYLSLCAKENCAYDHLLVTRAYLALDNTDQAVKEFSQCSVSGSDYDDILYYYTWTALYKKLGDFEKALEGQIKHETAVENISLQVFNNDVRFLEERHKTELEKQRDSYIKSWLTLLIILLAGLAGYGVFRMMEYRTALKSAKEEYDLIVKLTENEDGSLKDILSERLHALRPYIVKKNVLPVMTGRKGLEKMKENRKALLRSIGMIYALTFPKFVSALVERNLTPEEIGLCSVYVSGSSSKELASLLQRKDIYHINSSIRAKIGEEIASNSIHSWLKKQFAELQ
jgi:hypothetical protein